MSTFRAICVKQAKPAKEDRWAVERSEPDGLAIVVSSLFQTARSAEIEAARLNEEASRLPVT